MNEPDKTIVQTKQQEASSTRRLLDVSIETRTGQLHCVCAWPQHFNRDSFLAVAAFALLHLARSAGGGSPADFLRDLHDPLIAAEMTTAPPKDLI